MSRRRGKVDPRPMIGDPKFNDKVITKFINCLMVDGKKSVAESVFYDALEVINKKTGQDPYTVFQEALENVKPQVEVKSRRVGGVTYQVPIEVRPERRLALGIRWLIRYSRDRNEKSMKNKLAAEFMEAQKGTGSAIKKKEDIRKMADANKAFSHYRW
jgi:small subunit ribosomal protein S7